MKHTPGPWVVDMDNARQPGSRRKRNPLPTILMVVAEKGEMPGLIVNQGAIEPRDVANACLVAAAPELLAACRAMWESYAYTNPAISRGAAMAMAAQAIAKAEGK